MQQVSRQVAAWLEVSDYFPVWFSFVDGLEEEISMPVVVFGFVKTL
jgi:hypothetical protein